MCFFFCSSFACILHRISWTRKDTTITANPTLETKGGRKEQRNLHTHQPIASMANIPSNKRRHGISSQINRFALVKKKKVSLRCVKKKPSKRSCDSVEVVIWMEVGGKYSTREAKKRRFIRANWRYTPANIKLWTLQRPPITTTQLGYRPIWLLSEIDNSWKIGHSAIGVFMLWP